MIDNQYEYNNNNNDNDNNNNNNNNNTTRVVNTTPQSSLSVKFVLNRSSIAYFGNSFQLNRN